jgi:hypothetical protein
MTLKEYFKKYNIKLTHFAELHRISRFSINRYIKGISPRRDIAKLIVKVTNGEVTFKDLGIDV